MGSQQIIFGSAITERNADIVFCIDSTESMEPCFAGIKANLNEFINDLGLVGTVDWRFRLVAYRDKHDKDCGVPWQEFEFTKSAETFINNLKCVTPRGGGDASESTLDALYISIKSRWRTNAGLQKVIILLTDADSHPTLHHSTYSRPDNNVERVIQEFQTLKHSMLWLIAPDFPIYQKISERMESADKKIIFEPLPLNGSQTEIDAMYHGLRNINYKMILKMISNSISNSF